MSTDHEPFERHEIRFTADGRRTHTLWRRFSVTEATDLDQDGHVAVWWSERVDERPEIEGRVATPDGQAYDVELVELAEGETRCLAAPLPALMPGAVVEVRVVRREHTCPFDGGRLARVRIPVGGRLEVRIEREGGTLHFAASGVAVSPEEDGEGLSISVDGLVAAPPDGDPWPELVFATSTSFDEVAAAYASRCGPALAAAPAALVEEVRAQPDRDARIATAQRIASCDVRYVSLALGQGALVPRMPEDVVASAFGDCKDKAALMVALLRAAGEPASLALTRTTSADPPAGVAGIEAFDHAIVHLGGDRWADPTVPGGALSPEAAGRRALVIDGPERGERVLPAASAAEHQLHVERVIRLSLARPGTATEHARARGWPARSLWPGRPDPEPARFAGVLQALDAETVTAASATRTRGGEVEVTVEVDGVDPILLDGPIEATLLVRPYEPVAALCTGTSKLPPHQRSLTLRFQLPPGVRPIELPASRELTFGPVRFTLDCEQRGSELVVRSACDTGDGVLSPGDAHRLETWLEGLNPYGTVALTFSPLEALLDGEVVAAIRAADALVAAHPDDGAVHGLRAFLLAQAGQRDAALAALEAVAGRIDEGERQVWRGKVLLHDRIGRIREPGMDARGAEAAFRAAGAAGVDVRTELAFVCNRSDGGHWFGEGTDFEAAAAALRDAWEAGPSEEAATELARALVLAGRDAEAMAFVEHEAPWSVDEAYLAAVAASRGVQTAVRVGRSVVSSGPELAKLWMAAWWLLARRGAAEPALLEAAAGAVNQPVSRLSSMAGTPVRAESLPEGSPARALADLAAAWLRGDASGDVLWGPLRAEALARGAQLIVDLVAGGAEVVEELPEVGALVRTEVLATEFVAAFAWEDGAWRFRACPGAVGPAAAESLRLDDVDAAQTWARWTLDLIEGVGWAAGSGRRAGPMDWFVRSMAGHQADAAEARTDVGRLWRKLDTTDPRAVRWLMAAVASGIGREPVELEDAPLALQVPLAEVVVYELPEAGVEQVALAWARRFDQLMGSTLETQAQLSRRLALAGEVAEAQAVIAALAARAPADPGICARRMFHAARFDPDPASVLDAARSVLQTWPPDSGPAYGAAWYLLFGDADDRALALQAAEASVEAEMRVEGQLHTVATARALAGDLSGALEAMRMARDEVGPLTLPEWALVTGLVAAGVGLDDAARAAFDTLPEPDLSSLSSRFETRQLTP